jgi:hypothetical protein
MRSRNLHLSTTIREDRANFCFGKPLRGLAYGLFITMSACGNLLAVDQPTPENAPDAGALPDNSDSSNPESNNGASPNPVQPAYVPPAPINPLLPVQGPGTASGFNGSSQSPVLATPALYATGANDLGQIATNAALSTAFSQGLISASGEPLVDTGRGPIDRIRLGPLTVRTALAVNLVNDDNILAAPAGPNRISDTSYNVTPAVLIQYGGQQGQVGTAALTYAPTLTRFFHNPDQNSDNQNVAFNAEYPFQRLTLNFNQTYSQVSGINTDLNARTTQTSSVTTVGGNYDFTDKLSLQSNFTELITTFDGGGTGEKTSSINTGLAYHLSDKITLGPQLNLGIDSQDMAPRQIYQQALLNLSYVPTEKINLAAQAGVEFRQFDQGGGDKTNPIFSASIGYTPFDSTSFSLNAFQNVRTSDADSEQEVVSTGVGFSANQRFLHRFFLGFSATYQHAEYSASGAGNQSGTDQNAAGTSGTNQDNIIYRPSISFNPSTWTSVALYYQYTDNRVDVAGESYHDNQAGISISAQF